MAFHIPYLYDYVTKLSRQRVQVIQNHENIRDLYLLAVRHMTVQVTKLPLVARANFDGAGTCLQ
jgi:hypothetical protein